MSIWNFTVEETNLIAVYKAETLAATIKQINDELPDLSDEEIISIAESALRKLSDTTEEEFSAMSFVLDEDEENE